MYKCNTCHLDAEMGMDREALRRRIARGAGVEVRDLEEGDVANIEELLLQYHRELLHSHQEDEADLVERLISSCRTRFVKIVPEKALAAGEYGVRSGASLSGADFLLYFIQVL